MDDQPNIINPDNPQSESTSTPQTAPETSWPSTVPDPTSQVQPQVISPYIDPINNTQPQPSFMQPIQIQPNITTPQQPIDQPNKSKLLLIPIFIILIVFIASVAYLLEFHNNASDVHYSRESVLSNGLSVGYINLPNFIESNCFYGGSTCPGPEESLAASDGHYVYLDAKKVYYDGKVVLNSSNIYNNTNEQANVVISQNGLHYAFITDDGSKYHIYIDGKPSSYILNDSNDLGLEAISNDGKSITYLYQNNTTTQYAYNLYINTKPILKNLNGLDGDQIYLFSSNPARYIIKDGNYGGLNEFNDNLYLANKVIQNNGNTYFQDVAISENGLHYAYIYSLGNYMVGTPDYSDTTILNVDGKNVGDVIHPYLLGITDNGDYYYVDAKDALLYINKKAIKLNSNYIADNDQPSLLVVNNNATHYFVMNNNDNQSGNNYYFSDGKRVQLPGYIVSADFSGNRLNLYRLLTNPPTE